MKKYTVDFNLRLNATFEGIEAHSEAEARQKGIDMLLDDPGQYLDFDDDGVDVYLADEGEAGQKDAKKRTVACQNCTRILNLLRDVKYTAEWTEDGAKA